MIKKTKISRECGIQLILKMVEKDLRKYLPRVPRMAEKELIEQGYDIVCRKFAHIKNRLQGGE